MPRTTDFITNPDCWEDVWTIWFVLVDDAYRTLEDHYGEWRTRGPAPIFHDSEVITVAMIIDTFFHGHEDLGLAFLAHYHGDLFPELPSPGHFNARRTCLGPLIDQVRRLLTYHLGLLGRDEPDRLIDSAPIPVCTYARASDNRTVNGSEYFGVMSSRGAKLFGFRIYLTSTLSQVIDDWMLVPSSFHDSQLIQTMFEQAHDLVVLGDGAYHNPALAPVLWDKQGIAVFAPPRRDTRKRPPWPKPVARFVKRIRRRIETALSVLSVVFHLERPGSRSLHGLVSRISTQLLAYNLCFVTGDLLQQLRSETPN